MQCCRSSGGGGGRRPSGGGGSAIQHRLAKKKVYKQLTDIFYSLLRSVCRRRGRRAVHLHVHVYVGFPQLV